jgi:hypothetical protein
MLSAFGDNGELNATTSPENMDRNDARGMQRIRSLSTVSLEALLFRVGAIAAPEGQHHSA